MIYEVRTYRLKPRGVPEFMNTFGKAYEKRQSLSKISAFFYTEIGPLSAISGRTRTRRNATRSAHGR